MNATVSQQEQTAAIQQESLNADTTPTNVTMVTASSAQSSSEQALAYWSARIQNCLANANAWTISVGTRLVAAKAHLGNYYFHLFFNRGYVPFGLRMGQVLMRLAKHETIRDFKFTASLPQSITALNELATLDPRIVVQGIQSQAVHSKMTTKEAKEFARKYGIKRARNSIAENCAQAKPTAQKSSGAI